MSTNDFEKQVREQCDGIARMLIEKSKAYGSSWRDPLRIFSRALPAEQLRVRIDDKLSRIARGSEYVGDDTVLDLIGYLILYRIALAPAPDERPDVQVVAQPKRGLDLGMPEGWNDPRQEPRESDGRVTADGVRAVMEEAVVRFSDGGGRDDEQTPGEYDGIFQSANFARAWQTVTGVLSDLDGFVVRAILVGRDDVEQVDGVTYRMLPHSRRVVARRSLEAAYGFARGEVRKHIRDAMNALGANQSEDETEPRDLALEKLDPECCYSTLDDFVEDFRAQQQALTDVTGTNLTVSPADAKWLKRALTQHFPGVDNSVLFEQGWRPICEALRCTPISAVAPALVASHVERMVHELDTLHSELRSLAQEGINATLHTQNARAVRDVMRDLESERYKLSLKLAEIIDLVGEGGDGTAFGCVESALASWGEERRELKEAVAKERTKLRVTLLELKAEKLAHDHAREQNARVGTAAFWAEELARHDTLSLDDVTDREALAKHLAVAATRGGAP